MNLASLDATMDAASGKHSVMARKQHGGHTIPLTDQQYRDLITVQLADWLEQVRLAEAIHLETMFSRFCQVTFAADFAHPEMIWASFSAAADNAIYGMAYCLKQDCEHCIAMSGLLDPTEQVLSNPQS